jgi:HK97 family phage major capsid protein/HK97 family phage prohead protease
MAETLKVGRLTRDSMRADIVVRAAEEGKPRTLTFPASSETPIDRWFGTEVLRHDEKSVRMQRLNGGAAPLLFNHDWSDPIGMIDGARIEDGRLVVDAHLFDTQRASEVATMIDGGMRNVSIGYEMFTVEEDTKANRYTATDWDVLEVSMVTVPADPSVGIGRSKDDEVREVKVIARAADPSPTAASPAAPRERQTMTVATDAAAGANAEQRLDPLEVEKQRRQAIAALCKANNIDGRVEDQWVRDGVRLETIAGKILEVIEERGKGRPTAMSDLGLSKSETQRFSVFKAIRAMRTPTHDNVNAAAYEIECSRAVAKRIGREDSGSIFVPGEVLQRPLGEAATRAMATTPGASGGYLVNVENMGFIDILRNRSVLMRMGARRLPGLVGNVVFPRQTGKATVVWQGGEGVSVTASDQTLGQLSMTPKTAIAITDVSEQLLRQSSPSAEAFIMADLAADVAIDGVDNKGINGTGGAEPLGIKNTTGITSGQDAASATYAKILAFVSTAGAANAIRGNPGFITTTAGASVLMQKQRFSSTDTPVWEGNMMDGSLVGFRAMSSEQLASGNLIFGSFDEVVIGEWGVLELAMDNGGTRFNQAQVGIRAMWMVDVLLRYPQSFVVSTNLSA